MRKRQRSFLRQVRSLLVALDDRYDPVLCFYKRLQNRKTSWHTVCEVLISTVDIDPERVVSTHILLRGP